MYFIYVLKSLKDNNLYIGCTSNLKKRLIAHNTSKVSSTKFRRPLKLIFKEEYTDRYETFNKEKYYKTVKGKRELKDKIKHCGIV